MGRWANFIDLTIFDTPKTHVGRSCGMPGLTFSPRYHKLDDTIFLLCRNCGHSVKKDELKKMATATQTRSATTRFRSNPKHFLTWSATAANHKIQKLSKNFVQNVSKLQSKMEKALHQPNPNHHQQWDPSCSENNGCSSTESHYNNARSSSSSSSAALMGNMSGVNVAVVHTLNVTHRTSKPKNSQTESCHNINNSSSNSNLLCSTPNEGSEWKNASRLRRRFDFEVERSNLAKSLDGVEMDMLELRPMGSDGTSAGLEEQELNLDNSNEAQRLVTGTFNLHTSSSSNNTSLSTISIGATTLPVTSPHWSRASSMSNSIGSSSSPNPNHCDDNEDDDSNHGPNFPSNRRKKPKSGPNSRLPNKSASLDHLSSQTHNSASASSSVRRRLLPIPIPTSTPTQLTVTIFEEEAELRHAPWFQAGIPREIALEVLKNEPIGSFIVRESTTKSGCFALSLRVPRDFQPRGIAHYLILKTVQRGYKIKGFTKEFKSLTSLITHHSVMPELLPCPLSLHLYRPKGPSRVSRLDSADFMEPEQLCTLRKYTDF